METSAIYSVAKFKGIKTACLLRVSDKLADLKWKTYWWSTGYKKSVLETSPRIMFEFLKLLANNLSDLRKRVEEKSI